MYYLYDCINHYTDDDYLKFYSILPDKDQKKVDALIHSDRKKLFLLSRILLSKLTIKYFSINYLDLPIFYNSYGKPLTNQFYFNISHSKEYAVATCSYDKIGIDIEYIREVHDSVIRYVCTPHEREYIIHSNNIELAFFEIYCLKEAYFKMIGTGIMNFQDIEFYIDSDKNVNCSSNLKLIIVLDYQVNDYVIAIVQEVI